MGKKVLKDYSGAVETAGQSPFGRSFSVALIERYGLSQSALDNYLAKRGCASGVEGFADALNNIYHSYLISMNVKDKTPTRDESVNTIKRIAALSEQLLERVSKLSIQQQSLITKCGYNFNGTASDSLIKSELESLSLAANKADLNNTLSGRPKESRASEQLIRMLVELFEQANPSINSRNGVSKKGFVAEVLKRGEVRTPYSTYKNWL